MKARFFHPPVHLDIFFFRQTTTRSHHMHNLAPALPPLRRAGELVEIDSSAFLCINLFPKLQQFKLSREL